MSMLSAQCDELRELADQLQEHGTFAGFGGTTNTDPLMHGAATAMREAADTIWELRGMVHKERAENAKLRELVRDAWGNGHPDRSCESCDIRDECHDDIERMRKDGVLRFSRCLFEQRIEDRMRELGVEVDDGY